MEAPEDNDGWSSAEELMNSSDAEEEGRVGPRKLVTRLPWPWGRRAPECDCSGAMALVALRWEREVPGARVRCAVCPPPPPSDHHTHGAFGGNSAHT